MVVGFLKSADSAAEPAVEIALSFHAWTAI